MLGTTASLSLRYLLIAAGCTTLGALAGYASAPRTTSYVTIATPRLVTVEKVVETTVAVPAAQPHARAGEVQFVTRAGSFSYMKLATIGDGAEIMPKHGTPVLESDDGIESAIAAVKPDDVPAGYRAWLERRVAVDGGCEAKVLGFAVLVRVTGSPSYAGDINADQWTAKAVFENGSAMLVAKLSGCTGMLARDAALPPIVTPKEITDTARADELGARAKAILLASAASTDTQKEWREAEQTGAWSDQAFVDLEVLQHPTTGVTWVSVHVWHDTGCGEPEANVWGLFRVAADGELVTSQLRRMSELTGIEQLVDIEGDGELELIGRAWLGVEQRIERASGD